MCVSVGLFLFREGSGKGIFVGTSYNVNVRRESQHPFVQLSHSVDKKVEFQGGKEIGQKLESTCMADANLNPGIQVPGSVSCTKTRMGAGGETVGGPAIGGKTLTAPPLPLNTQLAPATMPHNSKHTLHSFTDRGSVYFQI